MDVDCHRAAFRGSPMKRAKLPMLRRNAAVVLGNVGTAEDVPCSSAPSTTRALVREHAAWALRQLNGERDAPRLPGEGGAEPERRVDVRR
jgi:epoxyqueuosine reductase